MKTLTKEIGKYSGLSPITPEESTLRKPGVGLIGYAICGVFPDSAHVRRGEHGVCLEVIPVFDGTEAKDMRKGSAEYYGRIFAESMEEIIDGVSDAGIPPLAEDMQVYYTTQGRVDGSKCMDHGSSAHELAERLDGEDADTVIGLCRVFESVIREVCWKSPGLIELLTESLMESDSLTGDEVRDMIEGYDSSIMGIFVRQLPMD